MSGLGLGWLVGLSVSPVIQIILTSLVAVTVSISSALAGIRPQDSQEEQSLSDNQGADKRRARKTGRAFPALLDPLPVMAMVVGLACGASVGVYARANGWLAARHNSYVAEWKETGLSAQEITTRVFNSLYPPPTVDASVAQEPVQSPRNEEPSDAPRASDTAPKEESPKARSKSATELSSTANRQGNFRDGILFGNRLEQCKRLMNADEEDELRREIISSDFPELIKWHRSCKDYQCLRDAAIKTCTKYR